MKAALDGQTSLAPITDVAVGASVRIVRIDAGPTTIRRCLALGLAVGTELTVQQRRGRGVVVADGGNRIALGAELARQIVAEQKPDGLRRS